MLLDILAGILIGAVNDSWTATLIAPFIWAVVRVVRTWILRPRNVAREGPPGSVASAVGPDVTPYLIEYLAALGTSLGAAALTRLVVVLV